jgi:NAD(P)H-hydrate epimerase
VNGGATPGAVVAADATLTLALPKRGLRGVAVVGTLFLADISVPRAVTATLGPAAPNFSRSSILRVEA